MVTFLVLFQLCIVLALIFIGARVGGIGLGIYGMVGVFILVFMSACSLLFAIARGTQRSYGLIIAGLTLLVAMMGQSNPQITPLMPVLSSPLLSLHVCFVMLSYTLFAFLALNSLAALFAQAKGQCRNEKIRNIL